ncbi:alpha/beta hydrolase [Actinomadura sp. KC216]|uniref:alpha/beta hydrolase n=1 Tax=Actinomadura sp. KC216 TaxID=2530370 RepID=UPI001404E24F|nr:alpha/beta hydrolase [Actinomadura sp. KC216]
MKASPHERMVVDVEYAVADGERLLLDLYIPEGSGPHPVSLWVHGGAWLFGDRCSGATSFAAALAERGVAIASIDYRLGEAGAFPASIDDVRAAVRWLRAHGARHGLAIARIGAWGASAGGHLSLMAALDPRVGAPGDRIDAVVDFFGPTDLVARLARTELEREILPDPPDARYLRTTVKTLDRNWARAASPLYQHLDQAPPTLIVHGDRDQQIALDQSLRMHQALVAAGRDSQLIVLGGAGHEDVRFQQPWVLDATAAFLRHHLTG